VAPAGTSCSGTPAGTRSSEGIALGTGSTVAQGGIVLKSIVAETSSGTLNPSYEWVGSEELWLGV
jgi:hypothetical protein